jgi:hypothetical protein
MTYTAYEIRNPSFRDISLDDQIKFGINDWCCENKDGNPHYGRTEQQAIEIARNWDNA